jgi:DUF1680 family protein
VLISKEFHMPSTFASAAIAGLFALIPAAILAQQDPAGLALPDTAKIHDAMRLLPPRATTTGGLLGDRYEKNALVRLLNVDETELLEGFRHKPGKQAWIGEHVGKFLHAASLAYAGTGDSRLKEKITRVATELMKTQGPDGYLGTYTPQTRFGLYPNADWDVWVHKYDLLGLLTYYQYTGDKSALSACRKVGDLLINTFGPGRKSILSAGTHVGMAATSVLEPMVLLYRATADPRYLDFAKYLVAAWDEPNGPKIETTLLSEKSVRKTANGKAYEMLSNLSGLCELYRATGERPYLEAAQNAWDDVVRHRLYITGSGSAGEHWQDDYHLPNGNNASICETCVTVTWEQLNLQLLRLTGESKYGDQLERSVYNHLLGAQKPGGDQWCYYTPLQGIKPYGSQTNCCLSSGPRGVALLPTFVYGQIADGVAVNLYAASKATVDVNGSPVTLEQKTDYPTGDTVTLSVSPAAGAKPFAIGLRIPAWSSRTAFRINGILATINALPGRFLTLNRTWKPGDRLQITFDMTPRLVLGDHENAGKATVMVGPLVLAADEGHNAGHRPIARCELAGSGDGQAPFQVSRESTTGKDGVPVYDVPAQGATSPLRLVPFYAAGADGSMFAVWLNRSGQARPAGQSLLSFAEESQSAQGNQNGSITDDDPSTFVVTFNAQKQADAWFAVALTKPVEIRRVVYCHGRAFHDGGWFDTSAGKPRIQVRRAEGGPWQDVATLASYPDSTATKPGDGLRDGASFEARFAPVMAYGVRIIGAPACGDNPTQSFASCGELRAYK